MQSSNQQAFRASFRMGFAAFGAALALAACGGSDTSNPLPAVSATKYQVVSFGDSLSDVGTYAPAASQLGGGRFTTNPGQVWTQLVSSYYGASLSAAYTGGFGYPLTANAAGYGYAQGGSRVANPVGVGYKADGSAATTVPVTTQVQNYLAAHGSFNASQIVLINGGPNDVIYNVQAYAAGAESAQDAGVAVATAAGQLAATVASIVQAGATHVVVVNVPDIGKAPAGMSDAATGAALTQFSVLFNSTLKSALAAALPNNKAVIQIDTATFLNTLLGNYAASGFTVGNTAVACDQTRLAALGGSSLFCSPATLVAANADQTYMFADSVHPTTHTHALFAQYVEQQVDAALKTQ
jgi:phospholipase/lecithinase/hemolysin